MNSKNTKIIIVISELLFFVFLFLFFYFQFPGRLIPLFIAGNIGVITVLFTVFILRQEINRKKCMAEISSVLDAAAEDINNDLYILNKDSKLGEFYEQVNLFREKLKKKEDDRQQIFGLVNSIAVNIEIEKLLDDLMPKLMDVSNSQCCAFYIANNITNRLEIKASMGFNKNLYSEFDLTIGEGVIGGVASSKETKIIRDIPDDTIYSIRSVIGNIRPKSMMVVPIFNQDQLLGVIALVSIYDYTQSQHNLVDLMKYYIGVAITNGLAYEKTKRLTNELKFQNKLIQSLNDELEKNVTEHTNLMNAVLDSIRNEAIYALDTDCNILAWNTGAEETLEYKASDVIGKHIDIIFPDDIVKAGVIRDFHEKAAREGRNVASFWRRRSDGTRIFIEMLVSARYDINHSLAGFTTVTKDITHLTDLWMFAVEENIILEIMKRSKKPVLYADSSGRIKYASDAAVTLFGESDLTGCNICDFFDDNNGEGFKSKIEMLYYTSGVEKWQQNFKDMSKQAAITVSVMLSPKTYEKMLFILLE